MSYNLYDMIADYIKESKEPREEALQIGVFMEEIVTDLEREGEK